MSHPTAHNHLVTVALEDMRPTQITVGYAEVNLKREQWRQLGRRERKHRLAEQWFPSILGPKGRYYIVDHHHLGLALLDDGIDSARVTVLRDLSQLDETMFWRMMEHHRWVHPFDDRGRRRAFDAIPRKLRALTDDPYRSLAGMVRTAGGYAKDTEPFAEFVWADFFRPRINRSRIVRSLTQAIDEGLALAHSEAASFLPGWTGATPP
jgi:hypothetical protein